MAIITVDKLTDLALAQRACSFTNHMKKSKISLDTLYCSEHSPLRTQLFWVEMHGIPTFVSVHLVRHTQGVTHFVESNRDDRGGADEVGRLTPVNHAMLCNAQALINMARKRLCTKAHDKTQEVFNQIKNAVEIVDRDLSNYMVPECVYRNGFCPEIKSCDRRKTRDYTT